MAIESMKKSIIAGTIATIVGGLVLMIVQNYFSNGKLAAKPIVSSLLHPVEINLTGSNNDINLSSGASSISDTLNILGSNLSREISIGKNQTVILRITGSNNDIVVDKSISSNVSVSETGSNNSVIQSVW